MWIWWIVSLIVLIACLIFTYRMIVSSYDFLPADKKFSLRPGRNSLSGGENLSHQETIRNLKQKLKSVEENSSYYEIQFSKFQQRLKFLEDQNQLHTRVLSNEVKAESKVKEEDWKEMYFEENELKEKLENELDLARQKLEETESKLLELEKDKSNWSALKSDYDARLNDLQSLQNNIGLLQRQQEGAAQREKDLEQLLLVEINLKKEYAKLETNYANLKSETEDLRRQVVEMSNKEAEITDKISRLNQLESKVAIYEEEKAKMISDLELMVSQNKMFFENKNS